MHTIVRLTGYSLRHRWTLVAAYACLLVSTLLYVAVPRLLGQAIDTALTSGDYANLLLLAGAVVGISTLRGLFTYGQTYLGEALSQRVAYDLRNAFYDKLQRLSFAYHDRQQTGNLMSKATADVEGIRWFVNVGLLRSVYLVVLVAIVGVILLTTNWPLGLITLGFVALIAIRAIQISRQLRHLWTQIQADTGEMTTTLQENLSGVRVVKAFAAEDHETARFGHRAGALAQNTFLANRLHGVNSAVMTLIFTAAIGAILWFGGREVIAGRLTPGELAQFILYMGILTMPVRMTGWLVNVFTRSASAGQRIFEVLDAQSPVKEVPHARELPPIRGRVRFDNVSFAYDGAAPVLRDISFDARPGQRVALLGAPGSGKSTIIHLLPRFYDVSAGRVTIDDIDVRDVTLDSLRRNVSIVQQDVFLFNASIHDNIAYGRQSASRDEVVHAAQVAQLHDFIMALPNGYETHVGERGVTLSGGQRQRLAIARTLLMDPPILILDDSLSSVDAATERLLQQALVRVMEGRTTFIIAHRLTSVHRADLILVLDRGSVVERGTHRELLEHGMLYRRIYDLQLRPQESLLYGEVAASARGNA